MMRSPHANERALSNSQIAKDAGPSLRSKDGDWSATANTARGMRVVAVAALLFSAAVARAQSTIIADTSVSDWSVQIAANSSSGATAGVSEISTGGNPGSYLAVNISPPGPGDLNAMSFFTGQSYSPQSQGPITSITFSADLENLSSGFDTVYFGLFQGGNQFFVSPPPFYTLSGTSGWLSESLSLTVAPNIFFSDSAPGLQPNFVNGGPIEFGIVTSVVGDLPPTISYGIDNLQVEIQSSVPEPSEWMLMILGGLAAFSAKLWLVHYAD